MTAWSTASPSNERVQGARITVDSLTKVYETSAGGPLTAVSDVSFTLSPGEFVALIGPSGCGKSTVLKILAGLLESSRGAISIEGSSPKAGRRDLGIMLQRAVLLPWRTVRQNIELPFVLFRDNSSRPAERTNAVLELVGLSDFADAYPVELSGGMQQRVALARTLSYEPRTLLMDEPFGALDELTRERLNLDVAQIQKRIGATTILVTHSVQEAVLMSDRILVMGTSPGRVVGEVVVDLPRPRGARMAEWPAFIEASRQSRRLLGIEDASES